MSVTEGALILSQGAEVPATGVAGTVFFRWRDNKYFYCTATDTWVDFAGFMQILTLGTSAALAGALSDETGTGVAVFSISPTLVTPTLGAALATSLVASLGVNVTATARTATSAGATTGTIAAGTSFVVVTCDDANKIIILPAAVPGTIVILHNGSTGYELRSSAPATIAINGGTDTAAESAIPANSTVFMICVTTTAWKGFFLDADSDVAKVEAAAN